MASVRRRGGAAEDSSGERIVGGMEGAAAVRNDLRRRRRKAWWIPFGLVLGSVAAILQQSSSSVVVMRVPVDGDRGVAPRAPNETPGPKEPQNNEDHKISFAKLSSPAVLSSGTNFMTTGKPSPTRIPQASDGRAFVANDPRAAAARNTQHDSTTTVTTTTKPPLPSMAHGGFVFFLHVPKTGGTTIRNALSEHPRILYHFVSGGGTFNATQPEVIRYLNTSSRRFRRRPVLVWEIHGRDSPHLLSLRKKLEAYRRKAQKEGIPVFFFSVVREPLAHALSYFNFFHVQRQPNKHFVKCDPTEAKLLEHALHDPQCQFLARGENSLRSGARPKPKPTAAECGLVLDALLGTSATSSNNTRKATATGEPPLPLFDWVGTTERLNEDTLPLLQRVLGLDDENHDRRNNTYKTIQHKKNFSPIVFEPSLVSSKARNESISLTDLSPAALETLQNMSALDARLYESVKQRYPHPSELWNNY